jgi:uncharacterized peroxidase-related enzyme
VSVLAQIDAQFGFVPSMFQTLALNPTVLDVVMALQTKAQTLLDAKTQHAVALAVSQSNRCDYCLAVHTASAVDVGGMSIRDVNLAREGDATEPRLGAAALFAQRVVETRGQVSNDDLALVRDIGYTDAEILAIVTVAVQITLTNYINNMNGTPVDIPMTTAARTRPPSSDLTIEATA